MNKTVFSGSNIKPKPDPEYERVRKLMDHSTSAADVTIHQQGTANLRCLKCGSRDGDYPSVSAMVFLNESGEWEVDHIVGEDHREETAGIRPFTHCMKCGPGVELESWCLL